MKKMLASLTLILGILFFVNSTSLAKEAPIEYGGWSEDEGYYQNNEIIKGENSIFASPSHHESLIDTKIDGGKGYERVVAMTTWHGVYHYSQAWFQHRLTGSTVHSNRSWGTGISIAKSGWMGVSIGNNLAYQRRTSYGR